jgi:hypothetical protein
VQHVTWPADEHISRWSPGIGEVGIECDPNPFEVHVAFVDEQPLFSPFRPTSEDSGDDLAADSNNAREKKIITARAMYPPPYGLVRQFPKFAMFSRKLALLSLVRFGK